MRCSVLHGNLSLLAYLVFLTMLLPGSAAVVQSSPYSDHHADDPADNRPTRGQAASETSPDQVIVKFESSTGPQARDDIRRAQKLEEVRKLDLIRAEVARVKGRSVEETVRSLERHPGVEYAEPKRMLHATGYADEPRFSELWGLDNTGQTIRGSVGTTDVDVNAKEASEITLGDEDLVVAVIDSGVDFAHPDLASRAWVNTGESGDGKETNGVDDDANGYVDDVNGWDFVHNDNTLHDSGNDAHATHVAGTIAASVNGDGVVGVAPNVKIMSLKWLDGPGSTSTAGTGSTEDAILAIEYAKKMGAKISNLSWGDATYSQALKDAIDASGEMFFVAGAGNDGSNTDTSPFYPASFDSPNILSVTAIDNKGSLASFSNYGASSIDISAPGVDILGALSGYPEQSGVALSSVGSTGKALVAGFGPEEIYGASAQASFMSKSFGAVERGNQPIVLVDDDRSHVAGYPDVGPTLSSGIAAATGSTPEVIHVADGNGPTLSQLEGKTVVWATGQADHSGSGAATLTTADQQTLTNFLNGGGKLVLAGMDALRRIESSTLVRDVLKLRVVSNVGALAGGSALKFAATFNGSSGTAFAGESYTLNSSFAWRDKHDAVLSADDASARTQGLYPSIRGSWNYRSGTSMAVPYATGAAALAASTDPGLLDDPVALKDRIMQRGKPARATAGKTATGKIVDARTVSDVIAPTVSGVTPEDLSEDVPLEASVEAIFSEAMNPSTLTISTFTLTKEGSGTPVAAAVSYEPATSKAKLDPETNLDADAKYVATIKGGSDEVEDVAGNPPQADMKWSFKTLDTIPPDAPTVDLAAGSDTGASDTDNLTKDDTPTFDGTAEADSEVSIYNGTTLLGTAAVSGTGDYSFTVANGLGDGTHRITARATDAAGNSSVASGYLDVQIDTAASSAPVITAPADNAYNNDGVFTVSGSAEANSIVGLLEDVASKGTATADTSGRWSAEMMNVAEGSHTYTAKATDTAGNTSELSNARTVIVDTTAPIVVKVLPRPAASDVQVQVNVKATFSEPMNETFINANTFKLLERNADGTITRVRATVSYDAPSKTAILTPDDNLDRGAIYTARVTIGVKDLAGNWLDTVKAWRFSTQE